MAVRRQPTLRDIAAAAGVAVSTASRALTRPGRVNADTAERVMAVAKELGYIPSASARALLSGRTATVALVLPDVTNPVFFGLVRGTSARLRESGYVQVLADTEESVEVEADTLRKLRGQVDGAVLAASRLTDEQIAAAAADLAPILARTLRTGLFDELHWPAWEEALAALGSPAAYNVLVAENRRVGAALIAV